MIISFSLMGCKIGLKGNSKSVKILAQEQVKNELEYEVIDISLTDAEFKKYQDYAKSENEQLLKDLTPMDIFKFYYHAFKTDDYKAMYGFYIKGEAYGTPNWKDFSDDMKNKEIIQMVLLKKLEYNIKSLAQIKYDDKTSYIQVNFKKDHDLMKNTDWNFKLIKNSQDIWKMQWLPLQ